MSESERASLRRGVYLELLEPFLRGERRVSRAPRALTAHALLIVNLSGRPLPDGYVATYAPGMLCIQQGKGDAPRAGTVSELRVPPGPRHVHGGDAVLVLLLPPTPDANPKLQKMWSSCSRLEQRFECLRGRVWACPTPNEWSAALEMLEHAPVPSAALPRAGAAAGAGGARASRPAPPARPVLGVAALPPGGGKSSLFGALRAAGWAVASSDDERARGGDFDSTLGSLLSRHERVGYDKNVPNAEGLYKMVKVVRAVQQRHGWEVRARLPRVGLARRAPSPGQASSGIAPTDSIIRSGARDSRGALAP